MRPHEPPQPTKRHLYLAYLMTTCIGMLLVSIVITVLGLALVGRVLSDDGEDHPLCTYFEALSKESGVSTAEWIGYPQGWLNYPQEWDYETFTPIVGESGILSRVSGDTTWLFGFRTLKEDNGNHDFCAHVLIVSQEP
jgi:hypothetical protein